MWQRKECTVDAACERIIGMDSSRINRLAICCGACVTTAWRRRAVDDGLLSAIRLLIEASDPGVTACLHERPTARRPDVGPGKRWRIWPGASEDSVLDTVFTSD